MERPQPAVIVPRRENARFTIGELGTLFGLKYYISKCLLHSIAVLFIINYTIYATADVVPGTQSLVSLTGKGKCTMYLAGRRCWTIANKNMLFHSAQDRT